MSDDAPGQLVAANTDVGAIASLLTHLAEAKVRMSTVYVARQWRRCTGRARSAEAGWHHHVRIQARDLGEATKLAVEFGLETDPALFTAPIVSDGLVNATPLGAAGAECLNCDLHRMPDQGWVLDMVYDPIDTPLIEAARGRGLQAVTGLNMLVEQAATSFKLFFGQDAPRDLDAELWQMLRQ
jgi:shikimate dehydrogenase